MGVAYNKFKNKKLKNLKNLMSGSDWRRLLNHHRDGVVNVYVTGSRRRQQYTDANYNGILREIQAMKEAGDSSAVKINQLVCKTNENKEEKMMESHKKAWKKMNFELESKCIDCNKEIDIWRSDIILKPFLKLSDVMSDVYLLSSDYRLNAHQYGQNLKEEVKLLNRSVIKSKGVWSQTSAKQFDIKQHIVSVKKKHFEIEESLSREWKELNNELQCVNNQYNCATNNREQFSGGVAEWVWSKECPSDGLRQKMADEFEAFDKHFMEQLETLKERYESSPLNLLSVKWSEEDCIRYDLILSQYPPNTRNRRMLYIDRLMRELPNKSRNEIVDYESLYNAGQYYNAQKGLLIDSWCRAHDSLCLKVSEVYQEAMKERRLKDAFEMEHSQQKIYCETLLNKVTKWRKDCQELQRLETEKANEQALQQEAITRKEEIKLRNKTEKVKNQIMEYNVKKTHKMEEAARKHQQLMEEVRTNTEEEIEKGRERVLYREQLLMSKQEELIAMADSIKEREKEKEKRLESLREQVRVEASSDPLRILKETQSSKARVSSQADDILETQHPLFQVYSFTDQKILSDKRFKVSNALREAGLISTQYAQRILSSIPPPKPPRRDQKSSLFKE